MKTDLVGNSDTNNPNDGIEGEKHELGDEEDSKELNMPRGNEEPETIFQSHLSLIGETIALSFAPIAPGPH